jgi:cytochrome c peroxidase
VSATFLTVLLLLAYNSALLAASVATESVSVGPPPALAPGQAPPLPNQGGIG